MKMKYLHVKMARNTFCRFELVLGCDGGCMYLSEATRYNRDD